MLASAPNNPVAGLDFSPNGFEGFETDCPNSVDEEGWVGFPKTGTVVDFPPNRADPEDLSPNRLDPDVGIVEDRAVVDVSDFPNITVADSVLAENKEDDAIVVVTDPNREDDEELVKEDLSGDLSEKPKQLNWI